MRVWQFAQRIIPWVNWQSSRPASLHGFRLGQRDARSSPPMPSSYGLIHHSVYHIPTASSAKRRPALRPCPVGRTGHSLNESGKLTLASASSMTCVFAPHRIPSRESQMSHLCRKACNSSEQPTLVGGGHDADSTPFRHCSQPLPNQSVTSGLVCTGQRGGWPTPYRPTCS